jgi:hypothetical protein
VPWSPKAAGASGVFRIRLTAAFAIAIRIPRRNWMKATCCAQHQTNLGAAARVDEAGTKGGRAKSCDARYEMMPPPRVQELDHSAISWLIGQLLRNYTKPAAEFAREDSFLQQARALRTREALVRVRQALPATRRFLGPMRARRAGRRRAQFRFAA